MKKTIAVVGGVIVVVAGGWVGSTWYTGQRIEEANGAQLEKANALLAQKFPRLGVKLIAEKYERGVFSTQARYVLTSNIGQSTIEASRLSDVGSSIAAAEKTPAPDDQLRLPFDVLIEHGPFPKSALSGASFGPKMAVVHAQIGQNDLLKKVFALTKGLSPLSSNAIVSYNGDTTYDWAVPPVQYSKDSRSINFSGALGTGSFVRDTQAMTASMRIDAIKLQGGEAEGKSSVEIQGINASGDSRQGKFGVGIGQGQMKADRLVIASNDLGMTGTLTNAGYRVKFDETDTVLNTEAAYEIGNIMFNKLDMGSAQAVFKIGNLDGNAVRALTEQYQKFSSSLVLGSDDETADKAMNGMTALMGTAQQLMSGNPVVSLDPLVWKTDKGEQRASVSVQFGTVPMTEDTARQAAVKSVKRVDATLTLSKSMAMDQITKFLIDQEKATPAEAKETAEEQIGQALMLAQMMNLGKVQGDNLVSTLHYADGIVDLNGTKTPVDEFLSQFGMNESDDDDDDAAMMSIPDSDDEDVVATAATSSGDVINFVGSEVIGDILDNLGYSYDVTTDHVGDPLLNIERGETGTRSLQVVFYNCDDSGDESVCEDFQIRAAFAPIKGATLKVINAFNRENRWARVYLDERNSPVFEMDVNAFGGLGKESLTTLIQVYFSILEEFGQKIGATK